MENSSQSHIHPLGMADVKFYRQQAEQMRAEYLAGLGRHLVRRIKALFKSSAAASKQPLVTDHSVRA